MESLWPIAAFMLPVKPGLLPRKQSTVLRTLADHHSQVASESRTGWDIEGPHINDTCKDLMSNCLLRLISN